MSKKPIESMTNKEHEALVARALEFAKLLQQEAQGSFSKHEKNFYNKMRHIVENPQSQALFTELLESSMRAGGDMAHKFELIAKILRRYSFGDFFTWHEKLVLFVFLHVGQYVPSLSVPVFLRQIRKDSRPMLLLLDSFAKLESSIKTYHDFLCNFHFIAKSAFSKTIVQENLVRVKSALDSPKIQHISIKGRAFYLLGTEREYMQDMLSSSLKSIFAHASISAKSQGVAKSITLDMEEHRFIALHVAAFMEATQEYGELELGIALQAYIPESSAILEQLARFARDRVESGGKPLYIRLVKGANMQAQSHYAERYNWALPTFPSKCQSDAHYKKLLHDIVANKHYHYMRLGIASHNIFEIAYAYVVIQECVESDYRDRFIFEMSMGMSMPTSRILRRYHPLMLYIPVCDERSFNDAIAYLLRRLDENTGEANFLRDYYEMQEHLWGKEWEKHKAMFLDSLHAIPSLSFAPRFVQDRGESGAARSGGFSGVEIRDLHDGGDLSVVFEPDTDWCMQSNALWLSQILESTLEPKRIYLRDSKGSGDGAMERICGVDGTELLGEVAFATSAQIELICQNLPQAVSIDGAPIAVDSGISSEALGGLCEIFERASALLQARRGEIIKLAWLEIGKPPAATDMEISQIITQLRCYPKILQEMIASAPALRITPRGLGLVVASVQSHLGHGFSAVIGALACGNPIVFKPSSAVVCSSFVVCECLWSAGISRDMLCFLPARGSELDSALANLGGVFGFGVALGYKQRTQSLHQALPTLPLITYTHGIHAMIITKLADYDLALQHVLESMQGNFSRGIDSGFASSYGVLCLLIIEQALFDDSDFMAILTDILQSKSSAGGSMGDDNAAMRAATHGISVLPARDLAHAIELANGHELESCALASLDEDEWAQCKAKINTSLLLINQPTTHTTNADIIKVPSGHASDGLSRKIGGRNFLWQFVRATQMQPETQRSQSIIEQRFKRLILRLQPDSALESTRAESLKAALQKAKSYVYHREHEFKLTHECASSEQNRKCLISYVPLQSLIYRVSARDSMGDMLGVILGAQASGAGLVVSYWDSSEMEFIAEHADKLGLVAEFVREEAGECIARFAGADCVRYHGGNPSERDIDDLIYREAAKHGKSIIITPPIENGRYELLWYYKERVSKFYSARF